MANRSELNYFNCLEAVHREPFIFAKAVSALHCTLKNRTFNLRKIFVRFDCTLLLLALV